MTTAADIIDRVVETETRIAALPVAEARREAAKIATDYVLDGRLVDAAERGLARATGRLAGPIVSVAERKRHREACLAGTARSEAMYVKVAAEYGLSGTATRGVMAGIYVLVRRRLGQRRQRNHVSPAVAIQMLYRDFPAAMSDEDAGCTRGGMDCPLHGDMIREDRREVRELQGRLRRLIGDLRAMIPAECR